VNRQEVYVAQSSSWADDTYGKLRASRQRAHWVAGVALTVALAEAFALAALAPLKRVEPYTITVDKQTGRVELAQGVQLGKLSEDEALTHSFLAQYVLARETYDVTDFKDNYKKAAAWSVGDARTTYVRQFDRTQPDNLFSRYGPDTIVSIAVNSISILEPGSALVRFEATERPVGAPNGVTNFYTAVVGFRYSGAPGRMEDRVLNPLGFQVTRYRRDSEMGGGR